MGEHDPATGTPPSPPRSWREKLARLDEPWRSALYGLLLGLFVCVAAQAFLSGDMRWLGLLPVVVCGLLGYGIGLALDIDTD